MTREETSGQRDNPSIDAQEETAGTPAGRKWAAEPETVKSGELQNGAGQMMVGPSDVLQGHRLSEAATVRPAVTKQRGFELSGEAGTVFGGLHEIESARQGAETVCTNTQDRCAQKTKQGDLGLSGAMGAVSGGLHETESALGEPLLPLVVNRISINAVTIRAQVSVAGQLVQAVVDSGAEVTIWSSRHYYSLPSDKRPALKKPTINLVVADQQQNLPAEGVALARLRVHTREFDCPVHVAPISDPLLLGSDILDAQDISVGSRRGLLIDDTWVPCEVTRREVGVCRMSVSIDKAITVQPGQEMVVTVPLDLPQDQVAGAAILEPLVEDQRGLLIGRCLIDLNQQQVPVRMVNLSDQTIKLKRDHPLGVLQPIEQEVLSLGDCQVLVRQTTAEVAESGNSAPAPATLAGVDAGPSSDHVDKSPMAPVPPYETVENEVVREGQGLPSHLHDLYVSAAQGIPDPAVRKQLCEILGRRQGAFAKHKLDVGYFTDICHEINTDFAAPVKERVRPTPRGFEDEERKCLEEQLEAGVIRPSSSPWAAPTVLVRKSDGSVRWCIDYRKLNDRSVKDAYPLPKINMCLDSLGGARFFTTLDLQSGYWQIAMAESDIPKTAFITKYGLYEYTKMPFGLCSAPSTFQRCMELVFWGLQWQTILIYLDDLIIFGKTMQENLEHLDVALERLESAGLKLKPSKCHILQPEVVFLGHVVTERGIQPNPRLIDCVRNWRPPKNRREVQQFLGLANYYRRFVPQFSDLAVPLTELTKKDVDFCWDEGSQGSFKSLVHALCTAPTLSFPRETGNFILDTDASATGVGGVLQQVQDGEEKVLAYGSKKLNRQQRNYWVTWRELLAIVVFLREFRNYLLSQEFLLRTDHSSLTWLLWFKEPQGQLARWLEDIYQFKYKILHREGRKHTNADALSRSPPEDDSCDEYKPGNWKIFLVGGVDIVLVATWSGRSSMKMLMMSSHLVGPAVK